MRSSQCPLRTQVRSSARSSTAASAHLFICKSLTVRGYNDGVSDFLIPASSVKIAVSQKFKKMLMHN